MRRNCPFPGCQLDIPSHYFACRSHWFMMTNQEKVEAWRMYNAWTAGNIGLEKLAALQAGLIRQILDRVDWT